MTFGQDEIRHSLRQLELALGKSAASISLTLVGSASFILDHQLSRVTHDIDVLTTAAGSKQLFGLGPILDQLGFQVVSESILVLHPDYGTRLQTLQVSETFQIKVLAPIDLVISKIGRGLAKDLEDIFKSTILDGLAIQDIEAAYLEAIEYQIGDVSRLRSGLSTFLERYAKTQVEHERQKPIAQHL